MSGHHWTALAGFPGAMELALLDHRTCEWHAAREVYCRSAKDLVSHVAFEFLKLSTFRIVTAVFSSLVVLAENWNLIEDRSYCDRIFDVRTQMGRRT